MKLNFSFNLKGLGKRIGRIPKVFKLLVVIAFHVLVFGLLFYLIIIPQMDSKSKLAGDYEEVKRNLDKMVAIKNDMAKYRMEYETLQQSLLQALKQLPDTKDIPNLLRNISNLGTETMLKVRYFEPKPVQTKEFFVELPFELRYSGPFHNVAYFFDGVRKLDRIVDITSFSLEMPSRGDPTKLNLEGQCTARTYVYVKDRPKEKKETTKEGKSAASGKR